MDIFHRLLGFGKAGRDRHNYDSNKTLSPAESNNTVELVDLHTLHSVELDLEHLGPDRTAFDLTMELLFDRSLVLNK